MSKFVMFTQGSKDSSSPIAVNVERINVFYRSGSGTCLEFNNEDTVNVIESFDEVVRKISGKGFEST